MNVNPKKWSTKRRWLTGAFGVMAALTIFFAVRLFLFALYWSDPAHQDQALQSWMTPRYVGHSWKMPFDYVAQSLDLDSVFEGQPRRITLAEIAQKRGLSFDELKAEMNSAIVAFRAKHD